MVIEYDELFDLDCDLLKVGEVFELCFFFED